MLLFNPVAQAAAPAQVSSAAGAQSLRYEVYGGGIKALTADLNVTRPDSESYRVAVASQTSGLARFLSKWHGTMKTQGAEAPDGTEKPATHEAVSVWTDNTQIKRIAYDQKGHLKDVSIIDGGQETAPAAASQLADQTVDLLTATLQLMDTVTENGTCNSSSEVFDGKRRFRLEFSQAGTENLKASRYNMYEGPAVRCEIKVVPLAGDWYEKLKGWMAFSEYGQEAGTLPVVWLAPVTPGGPAVPVKLSAKTRYGTFLAHLKDYHAG
jgi:hypothetical protein